MIGPGSISADIYSRRFRAGNKKNLEKNSVFLFLFEEEKSIFLDAIGKYKLVSDLIV
jgi:hypothetical protein